MSYTTRLIGNIQPGIKDEHKRFILPAITVPKDLIKDPTGLKYEFGTLGKGLEHIIGNTHINSILLSDSTSEIEIGKQIVRGIENLPKLEQNIVNHLLTSQYVRSQMLYRLASNEELQDYDNVTKGVIKGTSLGAIVGLLLNGVQYVADEFGLSLLTRNILGNSFGNFVNDGSRIFTELVARAYPGMAEASAIKKEVSEKANGGSEKEKNWGQLFKEAYTELPGDTLEITKATVDREQWYAAANVNGIVDKLRGRKQREKLDGLTEEWAEAQESGPYRGVVALGVLKGIKEAFPLIDQDPYLRIGYGILEAGAVFWVNTGNNVQGGWSVYMKCVDEARKEGSSQPYKDGFREFISDPFQVANIGVCALWYVAEACLRGAGVRAEELAGPLGAAIESSILSMDTAVVAQTSKPLSHYLVVRPAKKSVKPYNLMKLTMQFETPSLHSKFQNELMAYSAGRKAFAQYKRQNKKAA